MGRANKRIEHNGANKPEQEEERKCLVNSLPEECLSAIFKAGWHAGVDFYDTDYDSIYKYGEPAKEAVWHDYCKRYQGIFDGCIEMTERYCTPDPGPYVEATEDLSLVSLPVLSFNVKVSHVCRLWRHVALNTPTLWSQLHFYPWEQLPFERCTEWSKRVKSTPVRIMVDLEPPSYPCRRLLYYLTEEDRQMVIKMNMFAYSLTEAEQTGTYVDEDADEDAGPGNGEGNVDDGAASEIITLRGGTRSCSARVDKRKYDKHCRAVLARIFELIAPLTQQWEALELSASSTGAVRAALKQLAALSIGAAPKLNAVSLACSSENNEDLSHFFVPGPTATNDPASSRGPQLLFGGALPVLDTLRLDHVALNWMQLAPPPSSPGAPTDIDAPWRGLTDLCLSRLPTIVRPSYDVFVKILEGSPNLNELRLIDAGPLAPTPASATSRADATQMSTVYLSSLWALKLELDPRTAILVLDTLHVPYLSQLSLSLCPEDTHDPQDDPLLVLRRLCMPMRLPTIIPACANAPVFTSEDEAMLAAQHTFLYSVQTLILLGFQRGGLMVGDIKGFYEALPSLKELALDMNSVEQGFLSVLKDRIVNDDSSDESSSTAGDDTKKGEEKSDPELEGKDPTLCPQLDTLAVGVPEDMCDLLVEVMDSGLASVRVMVDRTSVQQAINMDMLDNFGVQFVDFRQYLDMLENK